MDETNYVNHQQGNVGIVEDAGRFVDNKIKFHEVYIKQESYENDSLINDIKEEPYSNVNCTDDNAVDVQKNSIFLENDEEDLYKNLSCKNEITCESHEITPSNTKDEPLAINRYCENCDEPYDIFCIRCTMLSHILDNCIGKNDIDRAKKTLPKYILDIRSGDRGEGVFARRIIPEGIYFGPFDGLETIKQTRGYMWKLKCGKFVNVENESNVNWMHYVNCARQVEDGNLIILQCEGNLYYRTDRKIHAGEELLIYHDEEVKLDGESEPYCHPIIQKKMNDVFACTFCCLGFSAKVSLVNHKIDCPFSLNEEVTKRGIIRCPYCKIYLDKREYLEFHLSYCYERNKGICKLPSNIQVEEDTSRTYPYECAVCKKGYLHKSSFNNHSCTGKREQLFQCTLCICKYRKRRALKLHTKLNHTSNPPKKYKCPTCNFETKYKWNLNTHAVTHGKKSFECEKCGSQFYRKYNLKSHRCTNKELYDCETCGKTFQSEKNLKMHSEVHGDVKFDCKVCGKEFKQRRELTKHNLLHSDDKSLECVVCLKKFARKESLKRHSNIHASKNKVFVS